VTEERVAWHPVPIPLPPAGSSRSFEAASRKMLLCNAGGTPYVVEDSCPHVRVSMEGGAIEGTVFECPHHGGRFELRDGRPVRLPIRRSVATFAVRVTSTGGLEVAVSLPGRSPWQAANGGGTQ
jgi:nitrite reductase/ring-hydroxylating ferredoxin subunit